MTVEESLISAYAWGKAHGTILLAVAVAIPVVGTVLARIGRGGRTDEDGRAIASALVVLGVAALLVELVAIHIAHVWFDGDLLRADASLAFAPIVLCAGCVLGAHWVFPLGELGGVHLLGRIGLLFLCCAGALWFFAQFRGWSIWFVGSFFQLVIVLVVFVWFVRRLLRQTFGGGGERRRR
jgi:hypothetical protein